VRRSALNNLNSKLPDRTGFIMFLYVQCYMFKAGIEDLLLSLLPL